MRFRDTVLHDGPLFRVVDVTCCSPASPCGAEEHSCGHKLVFVRRGVFVKHVGRREVVGDATRMIVFDPRITYRVSHPVDGGDRCTTVAVAPGLWRELIAGHDPAEAERETPSAPRAASLEPRTVLEHQLLARTLRDADTDALRAEEHILGLVDRSLGAAYAAEPPRARAGRATTKTARRELAERVKMLLASHPAQRWSLSDIARRVNSSPFHLARVFREETGVPIHQYLLRVRLAVALDRVMDDEVSFSELAYDVGFSSHAHFTSAFGQMFGMSPSAARARPTRIRGVWHSS